MGESRIYFHTILYTYNRRNTYYRKLVDGKTINIMKNKHGFCYMMF